MNDILDLERQVEALARKNVQLGLERDQLAAEVRRLRAKVVEVRGAAVRVEQERARLAAKVEAGAAVVRWWKKYTPAQHAELASRSLRSLLDELVRVYGEGS